MRKVNTLLIVALLFTACSTTTENTTSVVTKAPIATVAKTTTNPPTTTRAPVIVTTTRAHVTTTTLSVSCTLDNEARDLIRDWNRLSGQLLASYMDMSVSIPQFLEDSEQLMPKLSRVVKDLRYLEDCLPSDERSIFVPFLGTYNDKLSGYAALENALRLGSVELEDAAIGILMLANEKSMGMACEIARLTGEQLPGTDLC
ncbi:MAG: hypothetical protein CL517_01205 [Actinobacteria bacterium]|nr:hypothetical protein [Actinomycetota bacterium]